MVDISVDSSSGGQIVAHLYVQGAHVGAINYSNQRYNNNGNFSIVVPKDQSYWLVLTGDNAVISNWSELR